MRAINALADAVDRVLRIEPGHVRVAAAGALLWAIGRLRGPVDQCADHEQRWRWRFHIEEQQHRLVRGLLM